MANHLLLFASALVPKALASLMTSFCIELAKPENVSKIIFHSMEALPSDALSPSFSFLFSFSFLYVQPSVTHRYQLELTCWRSPATQVFVLNHPIRHLYTSHNAPYLPPKIWHSLCFSFLLGITAVPREIENNAYAKFWGGN